MATAMMFFSPVHSQFSRRHAMSTEAVGGCCFSGRIGTSAQKSGPCLKRFSPVMELTFGARFLIADSRSQAGRNREIFYRIILFPRDRAHARAPLRLLAGMGGHSFFPMARSAKRTASSAFSKLSTPLPIATMCAARSKSGKKTLQSSPSAIRA
jgi:hypothetical protein